MEKKKLIIYLFVLTILPFILAGNVTAWDISVGLSAGYNDNIAHEQTPTGSGFTSHQIKMAHRFFSDIPSVDGSMFIDGNYRNYFEVSDNYELRGGLSLTFPLANGLWLPHIFSEAALYRDSFMPEDDGDEVMAGGAFEWPATGKLTLGFRQIWRWLDYKEPVILYTGNQHSSGGMGHDNGYGPGGPNWQRQQSFSRNDQISTTGLEGTFFFSPTLQAYLSAEYNILNSDIETESYDQNGLYLSLLWKPHEIWEITARGFWKEADYEDPTLNRTDTTYFISLGISCFISNFEIFLQAEQTDNDSPLEIESYRQMVTQCGVVISF